MAVFESTDCLMVLSLDLSKGLIPALVEVLVLHEVRLLYLFPLAGLIIDQLLPPAGEVLDLQLLYSVLGHLSLHILALHFTLLAMLFKDSAT